MLANQVATIMGRIDAIWPPRQTPSDAERAEWVTFLQRLDHGVSERAVEVLKLRLSWRPSVADFKSAYNEASMQGEGALPQLPPAKGQQHDFEAEYGQHRQDWVYCWKCDMAITLEERCENPCYREGKGLHHRVCPRKGTAPTMPAYLRLEREEAKRRAA